MQPLTSRETLAFVEQALLNFDVPYICGPPGIGKSDIARQVAKKLNLKLIDVRLSQMLPEDLTGLPEINQNRQKASYIPFDTFPMEGDILPDIEDGWLIFLDELSSASDENLAASYSIILDHMVGGKMIHHRALIMAAGNKSTDSAIARPLPDTLITRMLPCTVKTNPRDWIAWSKSKSNKFIHEPTSKFIKSFPDHLYNPDGKVSKDEVDSYPTPRGWGKVCRIMVNFEKRNITKSKTREDIPGIPVPSSDNEAISVPIDKTTMALLEAAVGTFAAKAYQESYDKSLALPNPWEVATAPTKAMIPSTSLGKTKLTNKLAEYYVKAEENAKNGLIRYMNRLGGEHSALFYDTVKTDIGQSSSKIKELENIKSRLGIDDFLSPEPKNTNKRKLVGKSSINGVLDYDEDTTDF